jgi:predicted DNA-binding transcriptional regulator AlpA
VSRQTKQAAAAIVCEVLAESGSPTAEVAPLIRDLMLRVETVVAITGLSKPTIYRLIRQPSNKSFPKPLRLTERARGWRLSEVLAWVEGLEREGEEHSRSSGRRRTSQPPRAPEGGSVT